MKVVDGEDDVFFFLEGLSCFWGGFMLYVIQVYNS